MNIWDVEKLKVLEKYFLYILLLGSWYVIVSFYNENNTLKKEKYEDAKADKEYWHNESIRSDRDVILLSQKIPNVIHDTIYVSANSK